MFISEALECWCGRVDGKSLCLSNRCDHFRSELSFGKTEHWGEWATSAGPRWQICQMSGVFPRIRVIFLSPSFLLSPPCWQSLPLLLNLPTIAGRMKAILVVAFGPLRLNDFCCRTRSLDLPQSFCGVHNISCLYLGLHKKLRLTGKVLSGILML